MEVTKKPGIWRLAMKAPLRRICLILLSILLPRGGPAAEHSGNGWIIRKTAKETAAESGSTIFYVISVERTGPDAGEVNIEDWRGAAGGTTAYLWASPEGDGGGGTADYLNWTRTMNQGDKFTAIYEVEVDTGLSAGTIINNYIMADTVPYDPDMHISLDHYLVVGGGNKTRTANRGCGQSSEPVSTATGEFFIPPVTDMDLGGPLPLKFTRWYGSRLNDPGIDLIGSSLGKGWMHSFESRAIHSGFFSRWLRVILPGGRIASLAEVYGGEGGWQLAYEQEDVAYQGREDGVSFWLMDPESERLYRFDAPPYSWGSTNRLREIADRNGNALLLEYRADGRITNVADGLGRNLSFTYTATGNLLAVSDGARTTGFGCDAQGALISVTNPLGYVTTCIYDPVNSHTNGQGALMTGIQHPRGNVPYTQAYNSNGQVVSQTSACGGMSSFSYTTTVYGETTQIDDPQGSLVHNHLNWSRATNLVDQAGNGFGISYQTERNLPTRIRDRCGQASSFQYDFHSCRLTNVIHRDGATTTYSYVTTTQVFTNRETGTNTVEFDFQDLCAIRHPDGSTEEFHRDARGNVTSYVNRAGAVWTTTFNERGQPLTASRPGGGVQVFTYNPDGTLASEADSDTGAIIYTYDALRRRIRETRPNGGQTGFALDGLDRIVTITNTAGGTTSFQYDPNGICTNTAEPAGYTRMRQTDLMNRVTNCADSLGPLAAISYDSMGRPVIETDPAGTNHYHYDDRGWLTNLTRAGRTWSWSYDPEGHVAQVVSPSGNCTVYQRDPMGRVTNTIDGLGNAQSSSHDRMGRRILFTDRNGLVTHFSHEPGGQVAGISNALGATASLGYNADGLITTATDFDGRITTAGYTPMGRLAAITNALGEVTGYAYDTAGRLIRTDFPDGTHESLAYDLAGRLISRTDRGTNVWTCGYNARGDLVAVTNPAGGITLRDYLSDGTLKWIRDSDVTNIFFVGDGARRLVEVIVPGGAGIHYEYNAHHEITAIVDANSNRTDYAYDSEGRVVSETDAHGHSLQYEYDPVGRVTSIVDRTGARSCYEYDAAGRLTAAADPAGVRVQYGWDPGNRLTSATLGGQTWTRIYDTAGRLTAHSTPLNRTTSLIRDAAGRLAGHVDPMGRTNLIARDSMGRITAVTDPAGRARVFSCDSRGLLVAAAATGQAAARYERDALGNVIRVTDPNSNAWTFSYSSMGALLGMADPLGRSNVLMRNARGQISGILYPDGAASTTHYDPAGNVTAAVYSTGLILPYAYDHQSRLIGADGIALQRDPEGRTTNTISTSDGRAFGAAYDGAGRLAAAYYDGALTVTYIYNTTNGLLESVSDSSSGAAVWFSYDADRRLTGITRGNGQHAAFTLDDAGRITRIQDGTLTDVQYEYDAAGRLTAEEGTYPLEAGANLDPETNSFTYDPAAQISSSGFVYDARGRLTNAPGRRFVWDAASRLIDADGIQIAYDGFHDVLQKTAAGTTIRYYHNRAVRPASIVAERDETAGTFVRYYVWTPAGQLLYAIDTASGNKPRYYHFDRIGSTLAITDENGQVTDAYAYTPFGRIVRRQGASTQPFTFVGRHGIRQQDADGTLYQMRARYYNAQTGGFLSRDPGWPELFDARKINPYAYAGNDPVGRIDCNGRWWMGPDIDPLPDDADVTMLSNWQLTEIELRLEEMDRDDNINLPEVRIRKDRIRAELHRRNPIPLIIPPKLQDQEHTSCEQQPLNTAVQPAGQMVETPGLTGEIPPPPARYRKPLDQWTPFDLAHEIFSPENMQRAAVEQHIAEREARERAEKEAAERAEVERTAREALEQFMRRTQGVPPEVKKPQYTLPESVFKPTPRPFRDPLEFILDSLFGPQAILDFAAQQQLQQQVQSQAQTEASKPAAAPEKPRIPTRDLYQNLQKAQRRAAELMQARDFEGARRELDDARRWEQEIHERYQREWFTMYRD